MSTWSLSDSTLDSARGAKNHQTPQKMKATGGGSSSAGHPMFLVTDLYGAGHDDGRSLGFGGEGGNWDAIVYDTDGMVTLTGTAPGADPTLFTCIESGVYRWGLIVAFIVGIPSAEEVTVGAGLTHFDSSGTSLQVYRGADFAINDGGGYYGPNLFVRVNIDILMTTGDYILSAWGASDGATADGNVSIRSFESRLWASKVGTV